VRAHLSVGSTEIALWIVRVAAALCLQCTYALIHRYSYLPLPNPVKVKVPGVIVRLWPFSWLRGLQGQVNPLASSENHCSKDLFRARRRRLPFEPFLSRLTEQARSVKSGVKWSWAWTQACSLSIQSLPPQDRPCRTNPWFGSRRCQSPCAHALRYAVAFP